MTDNVTLILGFIFTFFLPGFLIIQTFYKDLGSLYKLPLIPLLSVLVSTYEVYFASIIFGYSKNTILLSMLVLFVWFVVWLFRHSNQSSNSRRIFVVSGNALLSLSIGAVFYLVFLTALYPAIFSKHSDYFVMSAVNWQDTAMHQSIIETISQGNFPPEAPYFSGRPLSYYYFIDFHSSILETLSGTFWYRVLVYDNPFFVAVFSLSIFALSYRIFGNRKLSFLSTIVAVLFGNLMFLHFLGDVWNLGQKHINAIFSLVVQKGYTLEYGKLIQLAPMADYFLQNRPMMIGLPAVTLIALLLIIGNEKQKSKYFLLAGVICALLIKFQMFAFGVGVLLFIVDLLIYKSKKRCTTAGNFLIPICLTVTLLTVFVGERTPVISMFRDAFVFGPWDKGKSVLWYCGFYLTNLGFVLYLPLLSIKWFLFRPTSGVNKPLYLVIWFLMMFSLPHLARFTIYEADMFKFFYFLVIPGSILSAYMLVKLWQKRYLKLLVLVVIVVNSFTSILTLGYSFGNKNRGYGLDEYHAGLWIRTNTPKTSVFVSYPSVHSAISEIGGRPRVLSYITWPYSHGFNTGIDNVFSRLKDVERLYKTGITKDVVEKYKVKYIYYGHEERAHYPDGDRNIERNGAVIAYKEGLIKIYKIQ